jgi:hypothetical protein
MSTFDPTTLEALIVDASVDAYSEEEQLTGLFTMIEENLAVPFTTTVLGVEVNVIGVDLTREVTCGCPLRSGSGPAEHRSSGPVTARIRQRGFALDRGIPPLDPLNWRVAQPLSNSLCP